MKKEQIIKLNRMAKEDWEKAQAMLDGINMVSEIKYGWLRKRVTIMIDGQPHDAWVWAE